MIAMRELDFWLAKGFGGIINMLHTRITQIPAGFSSLAQKLMKQEVKRLNELNEAVQANDDRETKTPTDMVCLDNWFIKAFTGLDKYLEERSIDGPTPISPANLSEMEEHVERLQKVIEREKCRNSPGRTAA